MQDFDKSIWLCDNGNLSEADFSYFISLRTTYLSLRHGQSFNLEPYCPYRFCKQFGFFQGVPSLLELNVSISNVPLVEAIKMWKMLVFEGSQSRVHPVSLPSHTWRDSNLIAYETWWRKVHVGDLLDNASLLNSSLDHDPSTKASRTKRKKSLTSDSSSDHTESEGTAGSPIIARSLPKSVVTPYTRRKVSNEDEGYDTDFKHLHRGVVAPTTVDLEHYDLTFDDSFADVPYSLDVPLGLALDEDFNLNDEAPTFLNDPVHDAVAKGFTSGRGKKSNVIKSSFVTDLVGSMGEKRNEVAMSPSNTQRSVDGPHSVEVAAKR
ncbi:hypothetical protein vseg_007795 [Gypsophila vaccaria]